MLLACYVYTTCSRHFREALFFEFGYVFLATLVPRIANTCVALKALPHLQYFCHACVFFHVGKNIPDTLQEIVLELQTCHRTIS